MSLAGSLAGTGLRAVTAAATAARARVMSFCRPGMRAFLAAGVRPGSASRAARPRSAAARLFRAADGGAGLVAGRVAGQLRVLLDGGQVVAVFVDPRSSRWRT